MKSDLYLYLGLYLYLYLYLRHLWGDVGVRRRCSASCRDARKGRGRTCWSLTRGNKTHKKKQAKKGENKNPQKNNERENKPIKKANKQGT